MGTRFSTFSIGFDRVSTIREEFSLLQEVAADCCGLSQSALTADDLRNLRQTLRARISQLQQDTRTDAMLALRESVERVLRMRSDDPMRRSLTADAAVWMLALGLQ
jgi:hypothetical protein